MTSKSSTWDIRRTTPMKGCPSEASIHYGRVYFHKPSVKPFRFWFVLDFFIVFYCVSSIHAAFLIFAFFVFCRWWVFPHMAEYQCSPSLHNALPTVIVQIRPWRQPKTSPPAANGCDTFFQACLNQSMNGAISGRGRAGAEKRGRFMVKRWLYIAIQQSYIIYIQSHKYHLSSIIWSSGQLAQYAADVW